MTPRAEVDITAEMVRALLEEQFPDLATAALTEAASGWDNAVFRLGADRAVRLPRREVAAELVVNEQRWLPELAPRLPLPVPVPSHIGQPGNGYPWPWSVVPWFPGAPLGPLAETATWPDDAQRQLAKDLGSFLAQLHQPAPADAPHNVHRGGPLLERTELMRSRFAALADGPRREALAERNVTTGVLDTLEGQWQRRATAEPFARPSTWAHGDIHPLNVLAEHHQLCAVIDFGDITSGDPACDLGAAWLLVPSAHHDQFRSAAANADRDIDDALWERAGGWALNWCFAVSTTSDDPRHLAIAADAMLAIAAD